MGAEPWAYHVPYQPDIARALAELRRSVFERGEFLGSELRPATIDEARRNMGEEGTASILDIEQVAAEPKLCAVSPLEDEELLELFGTTRPTREQVETSGELFDCLDRGMGLYVVTYDGGQPTGVSFLGYSFD